MILQNERALLRNHFLFTTRNERKFVSGDLIKVIRPKGFKPQFNLMRDQVFEVAYCVHGAVKLVGIDNILFNGNRFELLNRASSPCNIWLNEAQNIYNQVAA